MVIKLGIRAEDRVGTVINGWKILAIVGRTKNRVAVFEAQSVSSQRIINSTVNDLKNNKHAHCINRVNKNRNTRLMHTFRDMKQRCFNTNIRGYKNYGARGITVCKEWLEDPNSFFEWAFEHGYKDDLTIDRIDINKGYSPDNCRWISSSENSKWTRNSHRIWIGIYCDTARGWSLKTGKYADWFRDKRRRNGYDYAYQKLLERIEELGGIKKVMGVSEEEPDITRFLEDIDNDCLEADL